MEVDLGLILYKRLHIEGSTLRSRSLEYQANLIDRYILEFSTNNNFTPYLVLSGLNWIYSRRSQDKTVTDPFARTFIRQATDGKRFNWFPKFTLKSRCTLGRRYNPRIEKWPKTKTGK